MSVDFALSDAVNINITLVPGVSAEVTMPASPTATIEPQLVPTIEMTIPSHVTSGAGNVVVSSVDPNLTGPGLWVQTGMGPDGDEFTFWIEDGV